MKIKITEDIAIDGQHTPAGEIIDIDDETGTKLIRMKRAVIMKAADPEADLAQARAVLLELIAAAETVDDLNDLLSEDPEVVAAYETRLIELEDDH